MPSKPHRHPRSASGHPGRRSWGSSTDWKLTLSSCNLRVYVHLNIHKNHKYNYTPGYTYLMLCLCTFESCVWLGVCVRASVYGNSLYYCYVAPTHNCVVFIFMFVFFSLVVVFPFFTFTVPRPRECAIVLSRPSEICYVRLKLCSNWFHFWMIKRRRRGETVYSISRHHA